MTLYYLLSDAQRCVFGVCAVLLAITGVTVLIVSCMFHMGRRYMTASLIPAAVLVIFLQGINDVNKCLYCREPFTFLAEAAGNLPWAAAVFILMTGTVTEIVLAALLWDRKKNRLTVNAIKEGLDTLPEGVCFFNEEGQVLLVNAQMNHISGQLFRTEILNGEKFWFILNQEKGKDPGMMSVPESHILVCTPDGKKWDVCREMLSIRNHKIYELSACDVTGQYELHMELQKRNRQLSEVNERLRIYSREVEQTATEQEILAARMQIHDNVGRSLLAFRSWLENPGDSHDREELLLFWKYTINLLKNEAVPVSGSDSWELLLKAAEALAVTVVKKGELPEYGKERELLIAALYECLTNTVKHAQGDELYAKIWSDETAVTAEITNNGIPPAGSIQENGGLKNLRCSIEEAGGKMIIRSMPRFLLRISLLKGDRNEENKSDDRR